MHLTSAARIVGDRLRQPHRRETYWAELTPHYPERLFKLEANRTPLMCITRPADVAGAVADLLSEEASFFTGTHLFVSGG